MGGMLAQIVAARVPHAGLVLLSTAATASDGGAGARTPCAPWAGVVSNWGWWQAPTHIDHEPLALWGIDNGVPEAIARAEYAALVWDSGRVMAEMTLPSLSTTGATKVDYSRLDKPALVIVGADDRTTVPGISRATARKLKGTVDYHEIAGCGALAVLGRNRSARSATGSPTGWGSLTIEPSPASRAGRDAAALDYAVQRHEWVPGLRRETGDGPAQPPHRPRRRSHTPRLRQHRHRPRRRRSAAGDACGNGSPTAATATCCGWPKRADRRASPQGLWPEVRSRSSCSAPAMPPGLDPLRHADHPDTGVISVYALGSDYHDVIKKRLKALARWLVAAAPGSELKVFVDTAPVMEKPLAEAAGLGWQGKHTNVVSRGHGSWLFLGAHLHDTRSARRCAARRSLRHRAPAARRACPTKAFPAPYRLDARRCISYLTIEHKGPIPARISRRDRQPHLWLRRLPRRLPVEPLCRSRARSGLPAARRTHRPGARRSAGAR